MSHDADRRRVSRRTFLADTGMGFTGLALSAMLQRDGLAKEEGWRPPDGKPHFRPKAKTVIWFFMVGGTSHMESFDPKPELTRYAGKTIQESPYKSTLESPLVKQNVREVVAGLHKVHPTIYPLQTGYKKYGKSGLEVSDWWPHVGSCADDLAVVRSFWTTDNNHGAQLQFHTGRHALEGALPTIGSWVNYGLGSLNDNLPQFVVLGTPLADCCGGTFGHGANYLGPAHAGVRMNIDPKNPLPFAAPSSGKSSEEQAREFDLLARLNNLTAVEYPDDAALRARIRSYELAFRMQSAVPEVFRFQDESDEVRKLYGMDQEVTRPFGQTCLGVRRLVERGVRFIQIFHGSNGGAGAWDAHGGLKAGHSKLSAEVDKPIAGLLKDLKRRGLLDETLVVWGTEFGRTPGAQGSDGRDHHPFGFCGWLAGGGVKGGVVHGATDELGFHAVENRHYITDLHATVLHQLGLDPRKLEVPGRKRLDIDFGKPITDYRDPRMKIAKIETLVCHARMRNWIFVKVVTDQPGLQGWGEATLEWHTRGVVGAIEDLSELLIGEDPTRIEHLWQMMYRQHFWHANGIVRATAMSGIDIALWDILGKVHGVPCHKLWGGPVRDYVRLYCHLGGGRMEDFYETSPADATRFAELGLRAVEEGFSAFKCMAVPETMPIEGLKPIRYAEKCVAALRDAVGENIDIMVDAHARPSPRMGLRFAKALEPYGLYFFEEPCWPEAMKDIAAVQRAVSTPIATGERLIGAAAFRDLLEKRAASVLQPDITHCGGLTEARRIAALAEAYRVALAPHNPQGPVSTAASLELGFATPSYVICESVHADVPWRADVVKEGFQVDLKTRTVRPSTRPGLGIEIDEAEVRKHPFQQELLQRTFYADGSVGDW